MSMHWGPIETPPRRLDPPLDQPYRGGGTRPGKPGYRAVLREALQGVELGAYDRQMIEWMAGWDTPTVAVVVSLLHRAREAGEEAGRYETRGELPR
jgi:hypothetical protein